MKQLLWGSLLSLSAWTCAYADNPCQDNFEAKQYDKAVEACQTLIQQYPALWQYQQTLGNSEMMLGKYQDAVDTYEKAIPLVQKSHNTNPAQAKTAVSAMRISAGNCNLKLKKYDEAIKLYRQEATGSAHPGTAYFNICATEYNQGDTKGALQDCNKAITADPKKADAYFILGSVLYGDSTADAHGKIIPPPKAIEALNQYLKLAPNGGHAQDVTVMLEAAGVSVKASRK